MNLKFFVFNFLSLIVYCCYGAPTIQPSLEESGGFFEGDMNLSNQQLRDIFVNANAGLLDRRRRWQRDSSTGFIMVPFNIRARSYCKLI